MDYGTLVNNAFRVAWRYKTLWIFGLFAGATPQFNFQFGSPDFRSWSAEPGTLPHVFEPLVANLWPFIIAASIIGLLFLILSFIAQPALIDAVNRIARGGSYRFGESFSAGLDFFWRFVGLALLMFLFMLGGFLVVALIGVVAFVIHTAVGILSLLVLIPVSIVIIFIFVNVLMLGERAMVVRNVRIADALEEGWMLVRRNPGQVVVVTLIIFGLAIAFSIVIVIGFVIMSLPFIAVLSTMQMSLELLLLGILIGLPVSLVIGGFSGTFFSSLYTLFYFQLVEPGVRHYIPSDTGPASPESPSRV
jgi:hypothetical protein